MTVLFCFYKFLKSMGQVENNQYVKFFGALGHKRPRVWDLSKEEILIRNQRVRKYDKNKCVGPLIARPDTFFA